MASVLACFAGSNVVGQQTSSGATSPNGLQIEIQSPTPDFVANSGEKVIEVEGVASTIGGVKYLDMILPALLAWSRASRPEVISRSVSSASIAGASFCSR
jgi:hypothetical protein